MSDHEPQANLAIEGDDRIPVAVVRGEIDMANVDGIRNAIVEAVPNSAYGVVMDLSETAYLDSQGINMVITLRHLLSRHGQALRLVVPPGAAVSRLFEIVQLGQEIPVDHDRESAVAAVGAEQSG